MSRSGFAGTTAALFVWAAAGGAQTPFPSPPTPFRSPPLTNVQDVYLAPEGADLQEISSGLHTRRTVRTKGVLEQLELGNPGYFQVRDGPARVVVVPMLEIADSLRALFGRRVELVGHVRELERDQGTCPFRGNPAAPRSLCDDPELPPKPDLDRPGRMGWPQYSITVWSGSDLTALGDGKRAGPQDRLADVLETGGEEIVTAVGRFCGANLCGGLTSPPPSREAWVLQDGETAVWVIGRRPEGKGFRLDPTYKGDTARWLEVQGRLEACGAARCLRARSVALATRPQGEESPD